MSRLNDWIKKNFTVNQIYTLILCITLLKIIINIIVLNIESTCVNYKMDEQTSMNVFMHKNSNIGLSSQSKSKQMNKLLLIL